MTSTKLIVKYIPNCKACGIQVNNIDDILKKNNIDLLVEVLECKPDGKTEYPITEFIKDDVRKHILTGTTNVKLLEMYIKEMIN